MFLVTANLFTAKGQFVRAIVFETNNVASIRRHLQLAGKKDSLEAGNVRVTVIPVERALDAAYIDGLAERGQSGGVNDAIDALVKIREYCAPQRDEETQRLI